ncbi:hypothetical protein D4764_06G0010480 [Takifugu flavidus]|uniref:Uncharacterized protein n=1 Tax=Takifugu flavidus TaxID=433684 RepID=A0A5C6MYM5_9TELE|nr:hypothetical protein D4764_06G0010480 [Takifugu flavidus]
MEENMDESQSQKDKWMNKPAWTEDGRQTGEGRCCFERTDGWTDVWMGGWMDGWMDGGGGSGTVVGEEKGKKVTEWENMGPNLSIKAQNRREEG